MTEDFIKKLSEEVVKHRPWEWEGSIWETEGQYVNWLRSQFRSIWSDYPIKNAYLEERQINIPKIENGKQVVFKSGKKKGQPVTFQGYLCELTGKKIKKSKPKGQKFAPYNIDHIDPAGSCTTVEEALVYFLRLLTSPDNMQLIDTEIHKVISHYDKYKTKYGFTCFNDASAHKKMTQVCKNSKDEIKYCKLLGLDPESNSKKRKQQIFEFLKANHEYLDHVLDYK